MMVFVPAIAMFAVTSLMSGGNVRLIGDEIQEQFHGAGDLPFGSALGMTLLVLFIATFWASQPVRKGASGNEGEAEPDKMIELMGITKQFGDVHRRGQREPERSRRVNFSRCWDRPAAGRRRCSG